MPKIIAMQWRTTLKVMAASSELCHVLNIDNVGNARVNDGPCPGMTLKICGRFSSSYPANI